MITTEWRETEFGTKFGQIRCTDCGAVLSSWHAMGWPGSIKLAGAKEDAKNHICVKVGERRELCLSASQL